MASEESQKAKKIQNIQIEKEKVRIADLWSKNCNLDDHDNCAWMIDEENFFLKASRSDIELFANAVAADFSERIVTFLVDEEKIQVRSKPSEKFPLKSSAKKDSIVLLQARTNKKNISSLGPLFHCLDGDGYILIIEEKEGTYRIDAPVSPSMIAAA